MIFISRDRKNQRQEKGRTGAEVMRILPAGKVFS